MVNSDIFKQTASSINRTKETIDLQSQEKFWTSKLFSKIENDDVKDDSILRVAAISDLPTLRKCLINTPKTSASASERRFLFKEIEQKVPHTPTLPSDWWSALQKKQNEKHLASFNGIKTGIESITSIINATIHLLKSTDEEFPISRLVAIILFELQKLKLEALNHGRQAMSISKRKADDTPLLVDDTDLEDVKAKQQLDLHNAAIARSRFNPKPTKPYVPTPVYNPFFRGRGRERGRGRGGRGRGALTTTK
jgi:hypothetical protein